VSSAHEDIAQVKVLVYAHLGIQAYFVSAVIFMQHVPALRSGETNQVAFSTKKVWCTYNGSISIYDAKYTIADMHAQARQNKPVYPMSIHED
jgi:hypothetical protein